MSPTRKHLAHLPFDLLPNPRGQDAHKSPTLESRKPTHASAMARPFVLSKASERAL